MTILEEAHHSLIIIECDPLLYTDAQEMTEYISKALKQASHEATVLLYSPEIDPFLEDLTECQDLAENEGSEDIGGVYMISVRKDSNSLRDKSIKKIDF